MAHLELRCLGFAFVLAVCLARVDAQANTTQWSQYNYTFVPRAATWQVALQTCNETYGGHLVSIHSLEEQNFLLDTFISDQDVSRFPIELPSIYPGNDGVGHRGVWTGLRTDTVGGAWEDRSPVDFQNWIAGKPDNFKGQEACVQIYLDPQPEGWSGGWDDISCSTAMPYICKKHVGFKKHYTPLLYRGFEYIWYPYPNTFRGAEHNCAKYERGHLVSVASQDELAFLLTAFVQGQPASDFQARLPGKLYSADYSLQGFWLGYSKGASGNWSWTDGNSTQFTAWASGVPDSYNGRVAEDCSHVYLDDLPSDWYGLWNDVSCAAQMPYICKRRVQEADTNISAISWDPNTTSGSATPATEQLLGLNSTGGVSSMDLLAPDVPTKKKQDSKMKVWIGLGASGGALLLLVALVVGCSMMKIQQQPLYRNKMPPSANEV